MIKQTGLGWLVFACCVEPLAAETVRIENVHVIDMVTEGVRRQHAVHVGDGRIDWVGPADARPAPDGARTIDAQGGFLLPGLIDAHVHLKDPVEYAVYLASGVTTVLELGGPDHREWRATLDSGAAAGPRLLTCGPTITAPSAAAARAAVAAHHAADYDCVKVYDDMPADVFTALVAAAEEVGLPSTAHIPRNLTWDDMLTAAPDAVAHAEEFLYSPCCSEEDFARIATTMRERGIALITTLVTYDNITRQAADLDLFLARQPERYYPPVEFRAWRRPLNRYDTFSDTAEIKLRQLFWFQQYLVRYLHERGVRIVMGTDAGNTGTFPGISAAEELGWLVAAGLSPYDALRAATVEAAALAGRGATLGRITAGSAADLVLLAANPLDDISNVRFVRGVMTRGRWHDAGTLHAAREQAAARLAPERELVRRLETDGLDAALNWLAASDVQLRLLALNELAYQKLKLEDDPAAAVRIFRANTRMHPESAPAHASLAEGLLATDDRAGAIAAATQALRLAPDAPGLREELKALDLYDAATAALRRAD